MREGERKREKKSEGGRKREKEMNEFPVCWLVPKRLRSLAGVGTLSGPSSWMAVAVI